MDVKQIDAGDLNVAMSMPAWLALRHAVTGDLIIGDWLRDDLPDSS
jgi:hypothetical protein